MSIILGISAYYHDSAAVLVENGSIISAIEEERFTRIKHDNAFPYQAINFVLKKNNLTINRIDAIAYYEKPLLKFERILENFVSTYPFSLKPFMKGIPEWLDYKIKIERTIRKKLEYKGKIHFVPHHLSHAAAAYYPSEFRDTAILTIDGVGEYQTTGLWSGKDGVITPLKTISFPHSLGLLYSTFTAFMGFKINEDEYKLMGLAAYGKPVYTNKIRKTIDVKPDGSFRLDMKYFSFREDFRMWSRRFEDLFGQPRHPNDKIGKRHADLAASIQAVTEDIYFKMINYLHRLHPTSNICLAGGVALNALANGKLYHKTPFKNIYIFGAAGDNGAAAGAALYATRLLTSRKSNNKQVTSLYFGSAYSDSQIEKTLNRMNIPFQKFRSSEVLVKTAADLLAQGHIIGWFQGKMEFGPRALGNRSILCKPFPRKMKTEVNKIKIREQFRPFAGAILQERVHEYFDVPETKHYSPFMTFCFQVKKDKRKDLAAIVHADNTCRIQTVNRENGLYYRLIKRFSEKTGIACILNTSFNLKGEPIVETPEQAIIDFQKTHLDHLIIGSFLVSKR